MQMKDLLRRVAGPTVLLTFTGTLSISQAADAAAGKDVYKSM